MIPLYLCILLFAGCSFLLKITGAPSTGGAPSVFEGILFGATLFFPFEPRES